MQAPQLPQVSARVTHIADPERLGDGCYCDYVVELTIGEHTYQLNGWAVCGWLRPGAHADLDGSGLANWGSSQPGGWSSCSGDGATNGLPRVSLYDGEYGDAIVVGDVEGRTGAEIEPETWAAWADAIAAARKAREAEESAYEAGLEDTDEAAYDSLCEAADLTEQHAADLRWQFAVAIEEALPGCPDIPEPSAEDVYAELSECDVPGVRVGDYLGAGMVLAWLADGEHRMAYWPDQDDMRRAVGDATGEMVAILETERKRVARHHNYEED